MSNRRRNEPPEDIDCKDFVELITDYLEDVIPTEVRVRIDQHLALCPGCAIALAQWQSVIELTGHLADADVDSVDPVTRAALVDAFRHRVDE